MDQPQSDRPRFHCSLCEKSYAWLRGLKLHIRTVHENKDEGTSKQGEEGDSKQRDNKEMPKGFPSSLGEKTYSCPNVLRQHEGKDDENEVKQGVSKQGKNTETASKKRLSCMLCEKTYAWPQDLKKHVKYVHEKKEKKEAQKQGEERNMEQSDSTEIVSKRFSCSLCENTYVWLHDLQQHERKVHKKEGESSLQGDSTKKVPKQRFPCALCEKTYAWPHDLKKHVRSAHKRKQKQAALKHKEDNTDRASNLCLSCPLCDKTYVWPKDLRHHQRSVHQIEEKEEASRLRSDTERTLKQADNTERELKLHDNNKDEKIDGREGVSKQTDDTVRTLKQNDVAKRESKPRFPCSLCEKTYAWPKDLKNHERKVHGKERESKLKDKIETFKHVRKNKQISMQEQFTCQVCGEIFQTKRKLTGHRREFHLSSEQQFPCSKCSMVYISRKSLRQHERRIHEHNMQGAPNSAESLKSDKNSDELDEFSSPDSEISPTNTQQSPAKPLPFTMNTISCPVKSQGHKIIAHGTASEHQGTHIHVKQKQNERIPSLQEGQMKKLLHWSKREINTHYIARSRNFRPAYVSRYGKCRSRARVAIKGRRTRKAYRPYRCSLCHDKFFTQRGLSQHVSTKHVDSVSTPCQNELDLSGSKEEIPCEPTTSCTDTKSLVVSIPTSSSGSSISPSALSLGLSQTTSPDVILEAEESVSPAETRQYSCPECNRLYSIRASLQRHIRRNHSILKKAEKSASESLLEQYKCPECDKSYSIRASLQRHIRRNHPIMKKTGKNASESQLEQYSCNHPVLKKTEENTSESWIEQYSCPQCNKSYSIRSSLRRHIRKCHPIMRSAGHSRKYSCPQCDKSYPIRSSLRTHIKKYHPKKLVHPSQYSCPECDKSYSLRSSLQRHIRQCHPILKNFIDYTLNLARDDQGMDMDDSDGDIVGGSGKLREIPGVIDANVDELLDDPDVIHKRHETWDVFVFKCNSSTPNPS